MNTPAIHQAIQLSLYPQEMEWLCFSDAEYPEGITDLLHLCSSKKQLTEFAEKNNIDADRLKKDLLNFIEKAVLHDENSDEKRLGLNNYSLNSKASKEKLKRHYQLLMKIYHPDVNASSEASHYSSFVSNAYKRLKENDSSTENPTEINFTEYRTPPRSFYHATQRAESQISNTKTAIAIISALTIFTLVAITGHFYDPANPELIASKKSSIAQNQFQKATFNPNKTAQDLDINSVSTTQLQTLIQKLETAYENGDVSAIKPILANTPEARNQTDKQINDKLETLFQITDQRKMVLFSFDWTKTETKLLGKGKFLSRYKLVGEEKWLVREGNASITAESQNKQLKITQLVLENQSNKPNNDNKLSSNID